MSDDIQLTKSDQKQIKQDDKLKAQDTVVSNQKGIKVKIVPGCIACGSCYGIAARVFEAQDDMTSKVKGEYQERVITNPELIEQVKLAAQACPVQVIKIEEIK